MASRGESSRCRGERSTRRAAGRPRRWAPWGTVVPPYEMPPHAVARGGKFTGWRSPAFAELERWYAAADRLLREVRRKQSHRPGNASPVRCWPHHFDLATLIELPPGASAVSATIGVGLSPGDGSYEEPYFYVTPWPYPANRERHPVARLAGRRGLASNRVVRRGADGDGNLRGGQPGTVEAGRGRLAVPGRRRHRRPPSCSQASDASERRARSPLGTRIRSSRSKSPWTIRASAEAGMAPSRISETSSRRIPAKIGWPNPPAPTSAPSVAVPMLMTAALWMPARMVPNASGSSMRQRIARRGRPSASADSRRAVRDRREAGVGVAHDRKQAVEEQRRRRRPGADAEQRDHEDQQRQRGDRLDDADRGQHDLSQARAARRQDPERQRAEDGRQQRHGDQRQVLARPTPERRPRAPPPRGSPGRRTARRRSRRRPSARGPCRASRGR